jgi:hypothetical protein
MLVNPGQHPPYLIRENTADAGKTNPTGAARPPAVPGYTNGTSGKIKNSALIIPQKP